MSEFNPDKLTVEFRQGETATEPVVPRRYTLTHSDTTAQLFLTIGREYARDQIGSMRDEVLGEWVSFHGNNHYHVYLYVDGETEPKMLKVRDAVFRRELPLALEAIRYGDSRFFDAHTDMQSVPIIVFFLSSDPHYNKVENWGTFADYKSF